MIRIGAVALCTALLALILMVGCGQPPVATGEVVDSGKFDFYVAQSDSGVAVTASDLYHRMYLAHFLPSGGYVTPQESREFLDSVLVDTLLWFEAGALDLRPYPADYFTYQMQVQDLLIQDYFKFAVYSKVKADSQEVVAFYTANPQMFTVKEQVDIQHLMISEPGLLASPDSLYYRALTKEELANSAKNFIGGLHMALDMGVPFDELVKEYSHDEISKRVGGMIGWTLRGVYKEPFDSVAFSLTPGHYSEPYRDVDGWHIILVKDHVPEGPIALEREGIYKMAESSLLGSRANEIGRPLIDSLRNASTIVTNDTLLTDGIDMLTQPDTAWLAVVNGRDTVSVHQMKGAEQAYRLKHHISNTTAAQKRELLRILNDRAIIAREARIVGLDTLPDLKLSLNGLQRVAARAVLDRSRFDLEYRPSDSAISAYYESHLKEFEVEKPLTVQHIVTKDSVFAVYLRDQADAGIDFMDLARQYYPGEEAVRAELADLGAIGPRDVDTAFYRRALETPIGTVSDPIKTPYGYHIIKVLKFEPTKTLVEATPTIQSKLTKQYEQNALKDLRARLFAKYHVAYKKGIPKYHFVPLRDRKLES